jgi:hypothetical protein
LPSDADGPAEAPVHHVFDGEDDEDIVEDEDVFDGNSSGEEYDDDGGDMEWVGTLLKGRRGANNVEIDSVESPPKKRNISAPASPKSGAAADEAPAAVIAGAAAAAAGSIAAAAGAAPGVAPVAGDPGLADGALTAAELEKELAALSEPDIYLEELIAMPLADLRAWFKLNPTIAQRVCLRLKGQTSNIISQVSPPRA